MSGAGQPSTPKDREESDLDEALEETFPASDPPAHGGSTGPAKENPPQRN